MSTKQRIDVFISSTSIDLPEYRSTVRDAILNLGLFPSGMEHWPVSGENPVELCHKMVNDAEIYLGIYAHRYGWQPESYGGKSITELEYDWAGEVTRDGKPIPRLCFVMSDSHPWPKDRMELDAQDALNQFKARVKENQVGFFTTPDNLKAQVVAALAPYAARASVRPLLPYLRWLHEQSKRSGLLHVLSPRDASSDARPITVEKVYTPLDTYRMVERTADGTPILEDLTSRAFKNINHPIHQRQEEKVFPLTAMEAASSFPRLVLLGDPGSGKSTFVNFLALCLTGQMLQPEAGWLERLTEQGWEHGERLPVVVTLRDFAQDMPEDADEGTAAMLFDHIQRQLAKWKLEDAFPAMRTALDEGRAVVLLDGLDEVPASRRDNIRDAVDDFIRRSHPDNRCLITCRILSYANPDWHIPDTTSETIAPFDADKINHFVETWYNALQALGAIDEETARQRIDDLQEGLQHPHLQGIASNPMLLTVMAIVHNHTGTLPRESARLYDECVRLLMLRWRPYEARSLLETLDVREDDLYRLLWEIAYDAHDKQAEREGAADISEAAVLGIARKKLGDLAKAEAFCEYVEKRAGLLIGRGQDAYGMRVFTFPHRTFQEYLAGCQLASERFHRRVPEIARRGAGWRETVMLATGHLVFNRGDIAAPLDAVNAMCPERLHPQIDEDWRVVWLAGDILAMIGVSNVEHDEVGREVLPRVREWLAELVSSGHLPPVERAATGRTLSLLDDPRPGVGLKNGLPDIAWGREIPAGMYPLGGDEQAYNPLPLQPFEVKHPYRLAKYPVTYAQFQAFLDDEQHGFNHDRWWQGLTEEYHKQPITEQWFKHPNHPRDSVSWYQAVAFCRWLTWKYEQAGLLPEGYVIRLPTEQEWEVGARYPDGRQFPWGEEYISGYANVDEKSSDAGEHYLGQTTAVGLYPQGRNRESDLDDLAGNVWEWCLNEYDNPANVQITGGAGRVLRGGSWLSYVPFARCASRDWDNPDGRSYDLGFRVVCGVPIGSDL